MKKETKIALMNTTQEEAEERLKRALNLAQELGEEKRAIAIEAALDALK